MKTCPFLVRMALAVLATVACGSAASAQNAPVPSTDNLNKPPVVAAPAHAPTLPYGAGEVVKMYQGGINKDAIVAYINTASTPFRLNADAIIYLQGLGVPQDFTKAMLLRDGQLMQQQAFQQPPPGAMQPPPNGYNGYNGYGYDNAGQPPVQVVTPTTPAPQVTVVGSDYSAYDYGYPYYSGYPYYYGGYYYGWPLYGGLGWGRGWGYGGVRGGFGGFRGGGVIRGGGGFHGGAVGGFHGGGGGHGGGHR